MRFLIRDDQARETMSTSLIARKGINRVKSLNVALNSATKAPSTLRQGLPGSRIREQNTSWQRRKALKMRS
jgi:hypothetical protein